MSIEVNICYIITIHYMYNVPCRQILLGSCESSSTTYPWIYSICCISNAFQLFNVSGSMPIFSSQCLYVSVFKTCWEKIPEDVVLYLKENFPIFQAQCVRN